MDDKWAYTTFGALRHEDIWDFFGPFGQSGFEGHIYSRMRVKQRDLLTNNLVNVIGFDGKQWFAGCMGLPSVVLDHDKYPTRQYSYDQVGRPTYWLHGYTSRAKELPSHVPFINDAQFRELHVNNAVPLWDASIKAGKAILADDGTYKTLTQFEPAIGSVNLNEHLAKEAMDALRDACERGEPIALQYRAATKEWWPVDGVKKSWASRLSERPHQSPLPDVSSRPLPGQAVDPVLRDLVAAGSKAEESWLSKIRNSSLQSKMLAVGCVVGFGGIIGYWAYKHRKDRKEARLAQKPVGHGG